MNFLLIFAVIVFMVFVGWMGKLVDKLINKKIQDIDNDMLQKLAFVAVRYVDNQYKKATGSEKFKRACDSVTRRVPGVDEDDIREAVAAMYVNFAAETIKE